MPRPSWLRLGENMLKRSSRLAMSWFGFAILRDTQQKDAQVASFFVGNILMRTRSGSLNWQFTRRRRVITAS